MATSYSITITMDQSTVEALTNQGYSLYGFKGVQSPMPSSAGAPLVWFKSDQFSLSTLVQWEEQYQGYTSKSQIIPQGKITAGAAYDMNLGSVLDITSPTGTGTVVTGGTENAISLNNETTSPFASSGISQVIDGTANPLCAFPLNGLNMNVYAPIELVLLEFATTPVDTGTVIYQSFSQAALFNLTTEPDISIAYDLNKGWQTTDPNVTLCAAGTNLAPLLLQSSNVLAKRAVASFARRARA